MPLYNGETAPKALRGMLLVLYQLQIIIGYVSATNRLDQVLTNLTLAFS